jgi:hypothetical protein
LRESRERKSESRENEKKCVYYFLIFHLFENGLDAYGQEKVEGKCKKAIFLPNLSVTRQKGIGQRIFLFHCFTSRFTGFRQILEMMQVTTLTAQTAALTIRVTN